ncbi:hypothetical protein AKI39_10330 [Bordetella sp. H567]|uniref:hypothetical protein n=1 Tax=Bordetella sp. H567 TaxID=1697043 RepID=UPI00081CE4BA|nr:hypothetical protein [Bordetella sp. H567]AOB31003.1 hypothetical protein AKI39_10330 [Bordetella sp. H567]
MRTRILRLADARNGTVLRHAPLRPGAHQGEGTPLSRPLPAHQNWHSSQASIMIGDSTPEAVMPDRRTPSPAVSEVTLAITDHAAETTWLMESTDPRPCLPRAPAVCAAVDALLADCLPGPTMPSIRPPGVFPSPAQEPSPQETSLYLLGCHIRGELFDQASGWHERAASRIATAAAAMTSGIAQQAIAVDFTQLALALHISLQSEADGAREPATGDTGGPRTVTAADLDILDRVARLRDVDNVDRRKLEAAVDTALVPWTNTTARRVAGRVVDVVAAMAHEVFHRRVYRDEIEKLVAASDRDDHDAMHEAFIRLYHMDRAFASPHQSGVDRCIRLVKSLPAPVQADFMRTFLPRSEHPADDVPAQGLQAYLRPVQAGVVLGSQVSDRLRVDLQRMMADLLAAAAHLRGEEAAIAPAADAGRKRTTTDLFDMPAPQRPTLAAMVRNIWRRLGPATPLERAERRLFQAIKQQAVLPIRPIRAQWTSMDAAIRDVLALQQPPASYADVVQACVRTLTPEQCVALHHIVDSYEHLKEDDPALHRSLSAERKQHLAALDAALTKEVDVRPAMPAVDKAIRALARGSRGRDLLGALEALSACLDKHAGDLPAARTLCAATLKRLALPPGDLDAALARLRTLAAQARLKDDITATFETYRRTPNAVAETSSLMPSLRVLAAALEAQAA